SKELKSYLDGCANYGLSKGYIRSYKPYSAVRFFPGWRNDLDEYKDNKMIGEITRASYNTPVQAEIKFVACLNPFNCWKPEMVISSQII
ncbi:hypothetical protein OE165_26940, partial [Escherichia coli]|uniref:hypothetical protein n=1 Tax=Escherichia coli TaxID=562 RepID=UPI0021F36D21